jgi:hypothetical protein
MNETQSPDVFTRRWLLVIILCGMPFFFLFAVFAGDPGRGRAAAIVVGIFLTVTRVFWNLRRYPLFWVTAAILLIFHVLLIILIPWTDRSYPGGYGILPVGLLDYGAMYGCFKIAESLMKRRDDPGSPT